MIISANETFLELDSSTKLQALHGASANTTTELNRSYPLTSLLEETNRSYPADTTSNVILSQAETKNLLDQLNDPFLEYLLNQNNSESEDNVANNIFETLNGGSSDTESLIETFFAPQQSDLELGSLVFSSLYA